MSQRTEEITGLKTGAEVVSKSEIDAQNSINCASNRMYLKQTVLLPVTATTFFNYIPLKAPCNYTVIVKLSSMSNTGNQWSFITPYKVSQTVSGGAAPVVIGTALLDDGPGIHQVLLAKNVTNDAIDLAIDTNIGGTSFNLSVAVEIFCNKNF